jgi:hypothetical protein
MRRPLLLALALTMIAASPALAGPPWISIEYPVNPFNAATRGAFCLVRVYHHGEVAYYPVEGRAEGLVDGVRRTVKLTLTDTGTPGLYAVHYTPETSGSWLLAFHVGRDEGHGGATVIVPLDRNGGILAATVPTRQEGQYRMPVPVTGAMLNEFLTQVAGR